MMAILSILTILRASSAAESTSSHSSDCVAIDSPGGLFGVPGADTEEASASSKRKRGIAEEAPPLFSKRAFGLRVGADRPYSGAARPASERAGSNPAKPMGSGYSHRQRLVDHHAKTKGILDSWVHADIGNDLLQKYKARMKGVMERQKRTGLAFELVADDVTQSLRKSPNDTLLLLDGLTALFAVGVESCGEMLLKGIFNTFREVLDARLQVVTEYLHALKSIDDSSFEQMRANKAARGGSVHTKRLFSEIGHIRAAVESMMSRVFRPTSAECVSLIFSAPLTDEHAWRQLLAPLDEAAKKGAASPGCASCGPESKEALLSLLLENRGARVSCLEELTNGKPELLQNNEAARSSRSYDSPYDKLEAAVELIKAEYSGEVLNMYEAKFRNFIEACENPWGRYSYEQINKNNGAREYEGAEFIRHGIFISTYVGYVGEDRVLYPMIVLLEYLLSGRFDNSVRPQDMFNTMLLSLTDNFPVGNKKGQNDDSSFDPERISRRQKHRVERLLMGVTELVIEAERYELLPEVLFCENILGPSLVTGRARMYTVAAACLFCCAKDLRRTVYQLKLGDADREYYHMIRTAAEASPLLRGDADLREFLVGIRFSDEDNPTDSRREALDRRYPLDGDITEAAGIERVIESFKRFSFDEASASKEEADRVHGVCLRLAYGLDYGLSARLTQRLAAMTSREACKLMSEREFFGNEGLRLLYSVLTVTNIGKDDESSLEHNLKEMTSCRQLEKAGNYERMSTTFVECFLAKPSVGAGERALFYDMLAPQPDTRGFELVAERYARHLLLFSSDVLSRKVKRENRAIYLLARRNGEPALELYTTARPAEVNYLMKRTDANGLRGF